MGFNARSADPSRFSMVPRADVPRSVFHSEHTHKSTFDAGYLIPVFVDEILPGDSMKLNMTAFARLATPLYPLMDNLHLDTFFFFVPNRLVWENFQRFMGEQITPGASTSFLVPQCTFAAHQAAACVLLDYFGIPTTGQVTAAVSINALPLRSYNLIYNEWFRDQNIQNPVTVSKGDGPDDASVLYSLLRRGKRHDYFTSALPWPMRETSLTSGSTYDIQWRGGVPVSGLGRSSLVAGSPNISVFETGKIDGITYASARGTNLDDLRFKLDANNLPDIRVQINDMRLAFAAQRLMERDARGGSRYTEIVRSHFGVTSPDGRLQRPEYLGGGSAPISVTPIVQQSATGLTGGTTPLGQLGGVGTGVAQGHGFSASFTEHGHIIGLACVRADLTYQQGIHRMWDRRTKFDFYWPAFANLGEQPVLRREIYATGQAANDDVVFGYQERWAEYRHKPNRVSGLFRSTATGTLDAWHLAQKFTAPPTLSDAFIREEPPMSRVLALGASSTNQQVLFDSIFKISHVRPVPSFSVPGLIDHF